MQVTPQKRFLACASHERIWRGGGEKQITKAPASEEEDDDVKAEDAVGRRCRLLPLTKRSLQIA